MIINWETFWTALAIALFLWAARKFWTWAVKGRVREKLFFPKRDVQRRQNETGEKLAIAKTHEEQVIAFMAIEENNEEIDVINKSVFLYFRKYWRKIWRSFWE
jgi:hypothetical protein